MLRMKLFMTLCLTVSDTVVLSVTKLRATLENL